MTLGQFRMFVSITYCANLSTRKMAVDFYRTTEEGDIFKIVAGKKEVQDELLPVLERIIHYENDVLTAVECKYQNRPANTFYIRRFWTLEEMLIWHGDQQGSEHSEAILNVI